MLDDPSQYWLLYMGSGGVLGFLGAYAFFEHRRREDREAAERDRIEAEEREAWPVPSRNFLLEGEAYVRVEAFDEEAERISFRQYRLNGRMYPDDREMSLERWLVVAEPVPSFLEGYIEQLHVHARRLTHGGRR